MIIKGFWHIFMVNHWYSVIEDQLRILLMSGLYDACEEISIGCLGTQVEKHFLEMYIVNPYSKLKIKYHSERSEDYEFPVLQLIEDDKSDYAGFYFHAKGVTKPFDTVVNHWRTMLNEAVINQWRGHYQNIINGYDASSINFKKSPDHFSGNFWWFNRAYFDRLPKISSLNLTDRWQAEQLICTRGANGKFIYSDFKEPGDTVYLMEYKR